MGSDWKYSTVEGVSEKVGMGPFGSSIKVETFVDSGIPIISGQHLRGIKVEDSTHNFITFEHAEKLKNAIVVRGDVVFTHAGNIGQVAYIPANSKYEKYIISQRQFYMRCDNNRVIPEFVTYYFHGPEGKHQLLENTSSTGVPSISRPVTYLRSIEIPVPSLTEQRAIAHILGSLDDKIELNRRMNETLEGMAQALFKSWFIDFDPVIDNAILAGNPIPDEFAQRAEQRRAILAQNQPSPPAPLPGGEGRHYRSGYNFSGLKKTVRELRKKQTSAESIFWELIRNRQFMGRKFRRQHQIGDYVVDFYCHEEKLVIELDGGIHKQKVQKDDKRNAYMKSLGFTVLRFTNERILEAPDSVLTEVANHMKSPSPHGRGGGEGLPNEIRQLFPSAFECPSPSGRGGGEGAAGIGWIPKGWEVKNVGDLLELAYGKSLPAKSRIPGPYPVYGSGGIGSYHHEAMLQGPGVIVGRKGTVGSVYWEPHAFFPIDTVFFVKSKKKMPLYWIYQNLLQMDIASLGADSAVPGVNRNAILAKSWVSPKEIILNKYWELLSPYIQKQQELASVHPETLTC